MEVDPKGTNASADGVDSEAGGRLVRSEFWFAARLGFSARLGFLLGVGAILAAIIAPPDLTPHVLRSYYLEHFAAFYVTSLVAAIAFPRIAIRRLICILIGFAFFVQCYPLLWNPELQTFWPRAVANTGGVLAAVVPVLAGQLRLRLGTPRLTS